MRTALGEADLTRIDAGLAGTDALLASYAGDDGSRQPVHTVYVPADTFTPDLAERWGAQALAAADGAGGLEAIAERVGIAAEIIGSVAARAADKLVAEPVEDLRLDFEDGYGVRETEDDDAAIAAEAVRAALAAGTAPPFVGIRFKSLERPTRARGLRTLDVFLAGVCADGDVPAGLVLTLPKVSTIAQVEAMADALSTLERAHALTPGRLRFEVQVETPQIVLGADGRSPLAQLAHAVPGRISSLHYGTYDYSASLGIAAGYQSMEHPAADLAKEMMQLAVAGTGIRLSDGSTNILPVGDDAEAAWALHARLVRRSLERGFYQGWDLHPHQLITRFLATYAFYREGYPPAAQRLRAYLQSTPGAVLDEPATARSLAWFVLRGLQCGALGDEEIVADIDIDRAALIALAHPRLATA